MKYIYVVYLSLYWGTPLLYTDIYVKNIDR